MDKTYIAIDLKSFYASVECVSRGLDPLTTFLVVADESRSEKTICLAVSPALKSYGVPGRPRLFEVVQKVRQINQQRRKENRYQPFEGKAFDQKDVAPSKEIGYIVAVPRMKTYEEVSSSIYAVYLEFFSSEDIHVYSIDEVMIDVTSYLKFYQNSPQELAKNVMHRILEKTGITATCGIGTNLYLAKVAMDIIAKHILPDEEGARIASLDEMSYRRQLWTHEPLTDFWRVGRGIAKRLIDMGLTNMGMIARCSLGSPLEKRNEDLLYREFGVNAELLIDHAWGYEPCTIQDIHAYRPANSSFSNGQVLACGYNYEETMVVVKEMADQMAFHLVEKRMACKELMLVLGYDRDSVPKEYQGKMSQDFYGREVPKSAHGKKKFERYVNSSTALMNAAAEIQEKVMNRKLQVRRITIIAMDVREESYRDYLAPEQLDLFSTVQDQDVQEQLSKQLDKERDAQRAMLAIRQKYGKNAVMKGLNKEKAGTQLERNEQIGGHKA